MPTMQSPSANSRRFLGLVGLCLCLGACVSPTTHGVLEARPEIIESTTRYRKEYVLGPGDAIEVLVRPQSEVSKQVQIRPDGHVSLPLLDDVKAAGLTVSELDAKLTELYSSRLKNPEVTVIATSTRPPMVYVLGEVAQQKPVELRLATTAAQAIAMCGGFQKSAAVEAVAIIRLMDDGRLRAIKIPVELDGQPAPYLALANVRLRADDLLFVPEKGVAQIDRWINNWINVPLSGVNSVISSTVVPYLSIKTLEKL